MALESPMSRAGQIARQLLLFGRIVPNEELMDRLSALTIERLRDLSTRLFCQGNPTLAAIGPLSTLPPIEDIVGQLQNNTSSVAAE